MRSAQSPRPNIGSRADHVLVLLLEPLSADIENNTAKELVKLGSVIQVPFQAGNQFLGEDGLQVCGGPASRIGLKSVSR